MKKKACPVRDTEISNKWIWYKSVLSEYTCPKCQSKLEWITPMKVIYFILIFAGVFLAKAAARGMEELFSITSVAFDLVLSIGLFALIVFLGLYLLSTFLPNNIKVVAVGSGASEGGEMV